MKQRSGSIYDVITGLFVILTVLVLVVVIGLLSKKIPVPASLQKVVAQVPTIIVPPTDTPTLTPSETPLPTLTLTPSATITNTPLISSTPLPPTPTATPIISPTSALDVTLTQLVVDTQTQDAQYVLDSQSTQTAAAATQIAGTPPTVAPTSASAGSTPGGTQPAGSFPFAQMGDIQYTTNPDPTLSCNVEAIAGQVFDTNKAPLTSQVEIFIFNASGTYKTLSYPLSTKQAPFGVGYWLLVIKKHVTKDQYMVEVLDRKLEKQISTTSVINFTGDCTQNVALVNFNQIAPFTFQ